VNAEKGKAFTAARPSCVLGRRSFSGKDQDWDGRREVLLGAVSLNCGAVHRFPALRRVAVPLETGYDRRYLHFKQLFSVRVHCVADVFVSA
jgi:hypothetical protein